MKRRVHAAIHGVPICGADERRAVTTKIEPEDSRHPVSCPGCRKMPEHRAASERCRIRQLKPFSQEWLAIAVAKDPATECWLWTMRKDSRGYGYIGVHRDGKVMAAAHREFYRQYKGELPDHLHVCHRCDTPSCVNPEHLFLGTSADNHRDMVQKGRALVGARGPSAKLTDDDVLAIRKAYAAGERQRSIASRFGVHQMTVSRAVRGECWRNVL